MRTVRHPRLVLTAVVVLILFVVTADAVPPTPRRLPGPPSNAPVAVVTMGDSTISGEGNGDYTTDTNGLDGDWCHRSAVSEVHETTVPGVTATINLACSGADAADVGYGNEIHYTERSQAARLSVTAKHYRVTAVVVAVGANDDPHFSDIVNACISAWVTKSREGCHASINPPWQRRIDSMVPKVVQALRDVRTAMAGAGYQPGDYQLVLQSYAAPIGPDVAPGLQSLAGCPFLTTDLNWVRNTAVTVLDDGLRRAAEQAGTRFLDLSRAGIGHEACSGGNDAAREWFTRLTVAWKDVQNSARAAHSLQESFHPNARGAAEFGSCLTQFLGTTEREASCLPDRAGSLHPAQLVGPG